MKEKPEDLLKQLPDYLKGMLTAREKAAFEKRMHSSSSRQEIEELCAVWLKIQELPDVEPPQAVKTQFYTMLKAYKAGQTGVEARGSLLSVFEEWLDRWWPSKSVQQFGLAFVLLFAGLLTGYLFRTPAGDSDFLLLKNEVSSLRQLVATSLLQSGSASDRLRGVSYSYTGMDQPNEEVLNILLNTLNYDRNLNVRLAAVDALALYYEREVIRRGILESLKRQTSPLLQVALIDLLVEREERHSIQLLNYLQEDDRLDQAVRQRAGKAIEQLQ